jgi:hypothetical protein
VKGQLYPSEFSSEPGPEPGRPLWRLTSAPAVNHATYFLQSSITPDGQRLIFSSGRSGAAQLYSVEDFPRGPIRQWTDGAAIHPFSPLIHPGGKHVFFVRGGAVFEIEIESLAERLIVSFEGGQLGEVSLSACGGWLTAAIKKDGWPGIAAGRVDGSGWHVIEFPRTVIHPQFHPLEPEWIEFAGDPAPRMHRVRRDGSRMECLYEHGNGEFVVHETFLGRTGDLIYTEWPRALWRMSWSTRKREKMCDFNAWHITPNRAGTLVLCDTNHPDRGLNLIECSTGAIHPVCPTLATNGGSQWRTSRYALAEDFAAARSNAAKHLSWMEAGTDTVYGPQWTHPHPSFSPDERLAVFTSDRSGHPQVYAVALPGECLPH